MRIGHNPHTHTHTRTQDDNNKRAHKHKAEEDQQPRTQSQPAAHFSGIVCCTRTLSAETIRLIIVI